MLEGEREGVTVPCSSHSWNSLTLTKTSYNLLRKYWNHTPRHSYIGTGISLEVVMCEWIVTLSDQCSNIPGTHLGTRGISMLAKAFHVFLNSSVKSLKQYFKTGHEYLRFEVLTAINCFSPLPVYQSVHYLL